MNIEMKYYWALVVVFLASLGLIVLFHFFSVWPVVSDLAGLSAIGSLFGALFQIARDRIAFDRSVRLEEGRNRFTIGTTSHMASVAFDKHVSFCEEYVEEMQKALTTFTREGPSRSVLGHANKLGEIRRKWAVWLMPELETGLGKFEAAIRSMGAKAWLLDEVPKVDQRAKIVGEMYLEFAELVGIEKWDGQDTSDEHAVGTIIGKLRKVLGVDELTHLRSELVKRALENLKSSN